jgi:spore coat polysaccharide biosynthesis protein SpsF
MNFGFLITARLKSTRLPKKLLLPLNGVTVIERVIQRAKQIQRGEDVVLCTSYVNQDLPLVEISQAQNINYFSGDPEDVLRRLLRAAKLFGFDYFIGITADNPLFSIEYAKVIREMFIDDPSLDFVYTADLPIGLNMYGMSTNALETVCEVKEIVDTEIWGRLINRPEIFNVIQLDVSKKYINEQYRLTLDEPDDYKLFCTIYDMLDPHDIPSLDDIYSLLRGDNSMHKINSHVIQKDLDSKTIRAIDDYFNSNHDKIITVKNRIYSQK